MKANKLAAAALIALAGTSYGATIQWNAGFVGGLSSNLANAAGVVSNGLDYGIIVDTSGNGILASYAPISGNGALTDLSTTLPSDDVFFYGGMTSDSSQGGIFTEGDGTAGGDGGVSGINVAAYTDGVASGQSYYIVWFDGAYTGATTAGALNDPAFTMPALPDTVSHDGPWAGIDPVRPATGLEFVPEPSIALLGGLGLLGLIRRRR